MNLTAKLLLTLKSGGQSYADKVLGYSPAALWPMGETSGTNVDNAEGTASLDATHDAQVVVNATTGPANGLGAPQYNGTSAFTDIPHAALDSAVNFGSTFSMCTWVKVENSGVWTDGTYRYFFEVLVDGSNWILMRKDAANNRVDGWYIAGGTNKSVAVTSVSTVDWFHFGLTVDTGADEFKVYLNGSQQGTTQTGLGTWAGALTTASLGARNDTEHFQGYLAQAAIFPSVLSAADMLDLASV